MDLFTRRAASRLPPPRSRHRVSAIPASSLALSPVSSSLGSGLGRRLHPRLRGSRAHQLRTPIHRQLGTPSILGRFAANPPGGATRRFGRETHGYECTSADRGVAISPSGADPARVAQTEARAILDRNALREITRRWSSSQRSLLVERVLEHPPEQDLEPLLEGLVHLEGVRCDRADPPCLDGRVADLVSSTRRGDFLGDLGVRNRHGQREPWQTRAWVAATCTCSTWRWRARKTTARAARCARWSPWSRRWMSASTTSSHSRAAGGRVRESGIRVGRVPGSRGRETGLYWGRMPGKVVIRCPGPPGTPRKTCADPELMPSSSSQPDPTTTL